VRRWLSLGFVSCLVACSSSGTSNGGGGLDCSWLASDNCFKATVAAAASCLPPRDESGVFSQDGTTCTYASGRTVTFDPPIVFPIPQNGGWKFTMTYQGQTCIRVDSGPQDHLSVGSSAGTYSESITGLGVAATCPDGHSFSTDNALALLGCDAGFFGGFPGTEESAGVGAGSSLSFGLVGTSGGSTPILSCHQP